MIKSVKKFYLFIAFLVCLITLTSCIVVNNHEVHLEKKSYELMVGETADAVAWVTKDANKVDVMVGYQSYDSSIATYIDGKIKAIKAGEVRIKAYVVDNPNIYVIATVVVVDDISQTVEFDYSDRMLVGDTQTINYKFAIENTRTLSFTSSNANVATVDENGVVTAKSPGEVKITTKVASLYHENSYKTYTIVIHINYTTYPIVYELNGGINHPNNPEAYATEETPIDILEPKKLGFSFMGWYDNPEFNGTIFTSIQEGTSGAITLYAKWSSADYAIYYELNGGINHLLNPTGYTIGSLPIVLEEPTKNGYTFIGWYQGTERIREIPMETTGDIYLEAKWRVNDYQVSYELNGGVNNELNPNDYNVDKLPIALGEPTRLGYTFAGWMLNDKKVDEIPLEMTGNLTFVATWEVNTYTIEYDLQGGDAVANPNEYTIESETIVLLKPTKLGYSFGGWYSGEAEVAEIAKGSTGDMSLVAKWEVVTYTVSFDVVGGQEVNPLTYTIETEIEILPTTSKEGYDFLGWYNGETKVENIERGTTGNIQLVAKWEIHTYTVLFTEGVASQEVEYGQYAIEPTAPTKEGYTFISWLFNGVVFDFNTPITGNIELVASWEIVSYTITYQLDGGMNHENNPLVYNIDTETIVLSEPSKEGYDFLGWYNGETKVTEITKGSTGDITLTAKWDVQKFTVTFSDGVASQQVEYGTTVTVPTDPVKIGYQFVSWQKDGIDFNFESPINENITLTAKWELLFENGAKVVISTIRTEGNYFVMRSELTSSSTTRLVAYDLGTSMVSEIAKLASLDSTNIWTIEYDENAYYLKTLDGKYVSWTSGNSAKLVDTKYALMITMNDDSTYKISSATDSSRILQLNKDVQYNYFAFYTSVQVGNLVIQNYVEPTDDEKLASAVDALIVDSTVSATLELASTSLYETSVTWSSSNSEIITITTEGEAIIYQPENTTIVVLTATVKLANGATTTKDFEVEVMGVPRFDHTGTEDDPYSVSDAVKAAQQLASNAFSDSVIFVKGIVKSITYSEQYDNYEIVIVDSKDSDVEFKLYRAVKGDTLNVPLQNDTIVASGYIQNYSGNTPELAPNNSVNPTIVTIVDGDSTIVFTYNDEIVTVNHTSANTTNRLDRVFEVTVVEGYVIESVMVNGAAIEGVDGVYTFVIMGDTEVTIETKEDTGGDEKQEITYSYTFVKGILSTSGGTVNLNNINWTYSTMTYAGFDTNTTNKGFQIGSSNNPTNSFILSTSDIMGSIKSIVVNASIASSGKATLSISIGDTSYLNTQSLTTTATDYTITPNVSGEIKISFANTAKAFYIKSITIVYEQ